MASEGSSCSKATNPISVSCQSIASTGNASTSTGSAIVGGGNNATHYINGTGSLGRTRHLQQYHHYNQLERRKSIDTSDDDLDDSQATHVLERIKSDRISTTKPEEDRRRRTIIVEKKNGSFGFTLQSYGIHYKKEQEVEMITYVDYVEYDGPAYKAGMREGDVILSINGTDMEKADHKTLVTFIKNCDTRMRMVVLFEDCVRKVDLHMRYIKLQNILQCKMNELEKICLRERELLEGKWKTHSLPARKKTATSPSDVDAAGISPTSGGVESHQLPFYRSTLSTEDVVNIGRQHQQQTIIPPPAQFMLTYQYLEPSNRYVLRPTPTATSNNNMEYFISVGDGTNIREDNILPLTTAAGVASSVSRSPSDQHFILSRSVSTDNATPAAGILCRGQAKRGTGGTPPVPPPRSCEKHQHALNEKHQLMQQQHQQQLHRLYQQQKQKQQHQQPQQQNAIAASQNSENMRDTSQQKSNKANRHCHGHSCHPCLGHFGKKSTDKNTVGDNLSLDAYDLASPCCDSHCVPTRRRTRHKEHTHKHKHRDRDSKDHLRPKSQVSPGGNRQHSHHHHIVQQQIKPPQQQQQQMQQQQQHQEKNHHNQHHHRHHHQQQQYPCDTKGNSMRSRYFDLTAGLASHCSLHSCTSSEFAPADSSASYTTSLSTDTLYWDPHSENAAQAGKASRQHSTKSRQSYQQPQQQQQQQAPQQPPRVYHQRYHITATQVQPSHIYPNAPQYVQKPKSWDNLTTKALGGYDAYGFGYGYLDTVCQKPPIKLQITQQRHSIPRKNPYGRYSTYTDVENYAPPPSQFVEELTTMTTTTITTKSTEDLIALPVQPIVGGDIFHCDCSSSAATTATTATNAFPFHSSQHHHNTCRLGYYSHLPRPLTDVGTSMTPNGSGADVATISEVTRL